MNPEVQQQFHAIAIHAADVTTHDGLPEESRRIHSMVAARTDALTQTYLCGVEQIAVDSGLDIPVVKEYLRPLIEGGYLLALPDGRLVMQLPHTSAAKDAK